MRTDVSLNRPEPNQEWARNQFLFRLDSDEKRKLAALTAEKLGRCSQPRMENFFGLYKSSASPERVHNKTGQLPLAIDSAPSILALPWRSDASHVVYRYPLYLYPMDNLMMNMSIPCN